MLDMMLDLVQRRVFIVIVGLGMVRENVLRYCQLMFFQLIVVLIEFLEINLLHKICFNVILVN